MSPQSNETRGEFVKHLREEHALIEQLVQILREAWSMLANTNEIPREEIVETLAALKFVLRDLHHPKEEDLLFPALVEAGLSEQGGPACSLFMQYRVEFNLAAKILSDREKMQNLGKPESPSPHIAELLDRNSMLGIPIEEHLACGALLEMLASDLEFFGQNPSNKQTERFQSFRSRLFEYVELITLHIRKENECLFILVDECFSAEKQEALLEKARELNAKLNASDRIQRIESQIPAWRERCNAQSEPSSTKLPQS